MTTSSVNPSAPSTARCGSSLTAGQAGMRNAASTLQPPFPPRASHAARLCSRKFPLPAYGWSALLPFRCVFIGPRSPP